MGLQHQISSRKRWARTGAAERARLGKLHSAIVKKYWTTVSAETRIERAKKAALGRWGESKKP